MISKRHEDASNSHSLSVIQELWQVPAVSHFFNVFCKTMSFRNFDIDDLEESLLMSDDDRNNLLKDMLFCLVEGYYGSSVNEENLFKKLKEAIDEWCAEENDYVNPLSNSDFEDLTVDIKVQILFILCHLWLDSHDLTEFLKDFNSEKMKAISLGCDSQKSEYWFFHDSRLYKEANNKRPTKILKNKRKRYEKLGNSNKENLDASSDSNWKIICKSEEDWLALSDEMTNSKSKVDKELGLNIRKIFLSTVRTILEQKEKDLRRKLIEMTVKRESRRIAVKRKVEENLKAKEFEETEKKRKIMESMKEKHSKMKKEQEAKKKLQERENRALERQKKFEDRAIRAAIRENRIDLEDSEYDPAEDLNSLLNKQIQAVMSDLLVQDSSWMFLDPVDECIAPDYYTTIKNPICLKEIQEKIKNCYSSYIAFDNDFRLLVSNCVIYYGLKTDHEKMAMSLVKAYSRSCKRNKLPCNENIANEIINNIKYNKNTKNISHATFNEYGSKCSYNDEKNYPIEVSSENLECSSETSSLSSGVSSDYNDFEEIIDKRSELKAKKEAKLTKDTMNLTPAKIHNATNHHQSVDHQEMKTIYPSETHLSFSKSLNASTDSNQVPPVRLNTVLINGNIDKVTNNVILEQNSTSENSTQNCVEHNDLQTSSQLVKIDELL